MAYGDTVIYTVNNRTGKPQLTEAGEKVNGARFNFIILWREMDWSGYNSLTAHLPQFTELAKREDGTDLVIVER